MQDQCTTASCSCLLSEREHSPGLGAPKPLPGRSGVLVDWSFTTGLCAADRGLWKASHGRGGLVLIACKDASLFEAFSCPWTPSSTFYK